MDDDWLMNRSAAGDPRAFEEIVRRYERRLARFAAGLLGGDDLAVDAVQEAFLRLWRGRGKFEACGKLSAYLYRLTHSTCIDIARRRRDDVDLTNAVDARAVDNTVAAAVDSAFVEAVAKAVLSLPDEQRVVFVLSCQEGLSYSEIAEVVGCPVGTVASRKRLAVQALRQVLAAWED